MDLVVFLTGYPNNPFPIIKSLAYTRLAQMSWLKSSAKMHSQKNPQFEPGAQSEKMQI